MCYLIVIWSKNVVFLFAMLYILWSSFGLFNGLYLTVITVSIFLESHTDQIRGIKCLPSIYTSQQYTEQISSKWSINHHGFEI